MPSARAHAVQILLTGASGFIGRHLATALRADGHDVLAAQRGAAAPGLRQVVADFACDTDAAAWLPRLAGVDGVINAVGIFREHGAQSFGALHVRAPQALFTACVQAGVRRVVQISALGADEDAATAYHLSKRSADEFLARLPLSSAIVQPSLVYGTDGASSRLFNVMAALPLIPLPGAGGQRLQPVHVDDVVAVIVALLERDAWRTGRIAVVGPQPLTLRDYLSRLRLQLAEASALGPARFVAVPLPLVHLGARVADRVPGALLGSDALAMLERGNVADPGTTAGVLGRPPRPAESFIAPDSAGAVARNAQLGWLLPLLALALGAVWIASGLVSLFGFPRADSYALLARVGLAGRAAAFALVGAAGLDLLLGVLTLASCALPAGARRALWLAQIVLVLAYSAIITVFLPEFWLHPFGPVLKNLVLLAALVMLHRLTPRKARR